MGPWRVQLAIVLLAVTLLAATAQAATIGVRRADGSTSFAADVGATVDFEVVIDTQGEALTGWTFHVSYDGRLFRLAPASGSGTSAVPFSTGELLGGITLVNQAQSLGDEVFLTYTEALGGARVQGVAGSGVVARFRLEALRRSSAGETQVRVESVGHDRRCRYTTAQAPGVEREFTVPLGAATVRIVGFRVLPLPDVTLMDGVSRVMFDLDAFVDTTAGQVVWSVSRLTQVPTVIDPRTREVTMSPPVGVVGRWTMVFTAFETTEGMTAADTVSVRVASRPRISAQLPDTLTFEEDQMRAGLDLDAFVADLDDSARALTWSVTYGPQVAATINDTAHVLTLRAAADFFGRETVHLEVVDADGLADSASVDVTALPVNDPPQASSPPPVYPIVGQAPVRLALGSFVSDRDDPLQGLTLTLTSDAALRAWREGNELVVEGTQAGRHVTQIGIVDTSGARTATRLVSIVVAADGGRAPKLSDLPQVRLVGGLGQQLDLVVYAADDSPASDLTWTVRADSTLRIVQQGSQVRVTAQSGFVGTGRVWVMVTDPQGNADSGVLQVEVLDPTKGLGPALADPGYFGLHEEQGRLTLDLAALASDPDNTAEQLTWSGVPSAGLTFDAGTGVLALDPATPLLRPAAVTLRVTDPQGNYAERTVPVLVAGTGDLPQVRELPQVSLDSLQAVGRVDLDSYVLDDSDRVTELVWTASAESGVTVTLDPVTHVLRLRRTDLTGPASAVAQVVLRVVDTAGQTAVAALSVGLPPLFVLQPIADIELAPGTTDTSLVLDEHARKTQADMVLTWSVATTRRIDVSIDGASHRVRIASRDLTFQGSETLEFTATDPGGRSATVTARVILRGRGLTPQVRDLPEREVVAGTVATAFDLDDYVADDDPDSLLTWTVSGQRLLAVRIDPVTHEVTLDATAAVPGTERLEFLVRDPADNGASGSVDVLVLRGGQAPVLAVLPQLMLLAGGAEQQLDLSPFVSDADTPLAELTWSVATGPGVAARTVGSILRISVPAGEVGLRTLVVTVADPQGNARSAVLQVIADQDRVPPTLTVQVERHPVFGDLIEVLVVSSEALPEPPRVEVDTVRVSVEQLDETHFNALFPFAPEKGERLARITVHAVDRGGNEVTRLVEVMLHWMEDGGEVRGADPQVLLNVPRAGSGPGYLAVLYRLGEEEKPADSGTGAVYSIDLLRGRALPHPVTLNFYMGTGTDLGILRWNSTTSSWDEMPTQVDDQAGWLSTTLTELGLFRVGPVSAAMRQTAVPLHVYPQPLGRDAQSGVQVVYQVPLPGHVVLRVYNVLGQPVRTLVDGAQGLGTWSARWDGRDAGGQPVANGVYFLKLDGDGLRQRCPLVVVR